MLSKDLHLLNLLPLKGYTLISHGAAFDQGMIFRIEAFILVEAVIAVVSLGILVFQAMYGGGKLSGLGATCFVWNVTSTSCLLFKLFLASKVNRVRTRDMRRCLNNAFFQCVEKRLALDRVPEWKQREHALAAELAQCKEILQRMDVAIDAQGASSLCVSFSPTHHPPKR